MTICIIMGVAGSGKSTVGKLLGQRLGWDFYDGDDFHLPENRDKMSRGIALNDTERLSWLLVLRKTIDKLTSSQTNAIIACSALKLAYRHILQGEDREIVWVYLKGSYSQIRERLEQRQRHFMKAEMLESQFAILEEPDDVFTVDISLSPEKIVDRIEEYLCC